MGFLITLLNGGAGIYVKIGLVVMVLLGAYGAGWHSRDVDFSAYKVKAEADKQIAKNESIQKQQELVKKGIQDEYDAKLSLLRQYYSNGVRQQSSSSSLPPNSGIAPKQFDALAAYNVLAGQCAETTLMLVELQKWLNEQMGIK